MSDVLKGNFPTKSNVSIEREKETLEDKFERAAKARLGGSIAYVSKRRVAWTDDDKNK
ncbi:MAG: hypothetical protein K2Z80_17880 [Xanthobacteraceae bacterium]|nr:hypothetical protein [Xanthobacteraceae bacterium]